MPIDKIQEILVSENYVSADDMSKAVEFAKSHHSDIIDYLIAEELIDKNTLAQAIGEFYKMPFVDLRELKPTKEMVLKTPKDIAEKYRIVLFSKTDVSQYATDMPANKELSSEIALLLKKRRIILHYADKNEIEAALAV